MYRQTLQYPFNNAGMTLLEVILSLALLGGFVPVIGEIARASFQNARIARDLIQAELLAESILAKIQIGYIEMTPVFNVPVGSDRMDIIMDTHAVFEGSTSTVLWLYSIEVNEVPAAFGGDFLVEIAVTVQQNVSAGQRPIACRLVRLLALEPDPEEEEPA
jgi:type II secretory pathway pseudopilin PulG